MEETYPASSDFGENVRCITRDDPEYPGRLKALPQMPDRLYVKGRLPADSKPTAAVVGARRCSAYGRIQAFHYAKYLSCQGVQVISGLATGIDAEGHKGALEGESPTFAVLGNGADICYPVVNRPCTREFSKKEEGSSANIRREPGAGLAFSRAQPHYQRAVGCGAGGGYLEKSGSLITAGLA